MSGDSEYFYYTVEVRDSDDCPVDKYEVSDCGVSESADGDHEFNSIAEAREVKKEAQKALDARPFPRKLLRAVIVKNMFCHEVK